MNNETPSHRPTFSFSANRTTGAHRVRYREGTRVDPQECVLCVPVDQATTPAQATEVPCEPHS
ncbi:MULTISPECIES: hypothetical protein [unclassified Pseudomonas]|uniref:hypothetical protein n=1 Tax=unclassified Pseudomonas TaxID=196821 RepID=UPI0020974FD8|nr:MULTISPECIES: hypothetical protein [unclassified Pseudomonas]MCO7518862.1 hypothetical protein [Pseudomonas sp. 1]MCO7539438.1 hypothetical protein [Pseudomonas sp. VA159-2]